MHSPALHPDTRYGRIIERLMRDELMPAFPALHLVGPRGCGKTTSAATLADTVLDLSEPGTGRAARENPDGLLAAATGSVLVDEWQEAPEILGAVKRAVDRDRANEAGRFLIAGSARAAQQAVTWPGTGRLIRVRMHGLTQSELEDRHSFNPIDALFANEPRDFPSSRWVRSTYCEAIVRGRLPNAMRFDGEARARWYASYVEQLTERDVTQITEHSPRPAKLQTVLESCAARTGQLLNKQATARDAGVNVRTADAHISMLEDLSVVVRVPAWHAHHVKRLTQSPKVHLVDPGMAASLLNLDARALGITDRAVGQFFESFVVTELLPHVEAASSQTRLLHARSGDGAEVDVVLERHGTLIGFEVKSSESVGRGDARGLMWLRDAAGDAFRFGAVLYAGAWPLQLDDRIWALPISTLWTPKETSETRPETPLAP